MSARLSTLNLQLVEASKVEAASAEWALAREGDKAAVWVVDPATSKVRLRPVTVGQFREDGVTVTSGLKPGEVVVIAGVHKLRPDQQVRVAQK